MTTIIILDSTPVGLITNPKVISDKGDPLRSPLTPLKKGGIIGKAGIFKCGNHLTPTLGNWHYSILRLPNMNTRQQPQANSNSN